MNNGEGFGPGSGSGAVTSNPDSMDTFDHNNGDYKAEDDDDDSIGKDSQLPDRYDGGGGGGSIAERRAARTGFSGGGFRICTARFRQTGSPMCSPAARSPYITIPAGLSPTALLDSPIMLPNSPVDPSPTTGTFFLSPHSHQIMLDPVTAPAGGDMGSDDCALFSFQRLVSPTSVTGISGPEPKLEGETQMEFSNSVVNHGYTELPVDEKVPHSVITDEYSPTSQSQKSDKAAEPMAHHQEPAQGVKERLYNPMEREQRGTAEDGYNWRKYGQKQVKGSEFPRSYYKCTYQNCPMRKKVEHDPDGQITEIIYTGTHNHQKPQHTRRSASGFSVPYEHEIEEGSPLRVDGLASILNDIPNPLSTNRSKSIGGCDLAGTSEHSFTFSPHDDDGTTLGNTDADEEESEAKRRKTESFLVETNVSTRSSREPKVVVEIESEVDVLDDGYRWRKYGQKVVKGNPNPRSYYKCTTPGCVVRKQVERACHNFKRVITTYEGKHNHDVPAARNSHPNACGRGLPSQATASPQPTLPRSAANAATQPNSPVPDFRLHFEPGPGNQFTRSRLLGNFGSDIKFGAPSMCQQMMFPPPQNSMAYGNLLVNPTYNVMHQPMSSVAPVTPDFAVPLPWTFPRSLRRIPGGFNHNNQSFLGRQQFCDNGSWLLKPKEEHNDDDTNLAVADHLNVSSSSSSSSSSSAYCEAMRSFQP